MFSHSPRFYGRLIAATLVVALVAVPGISQGANEAQKIQNAKREIANIKEKLRSTKSDAAEISAQVEALESQIASLNKQIRTGDLDISLLESSIRTAEERILEKEKAYNAALEASSERARSIYKAGPIGLISSLLSAQSLGEFIRMSALWEIAAQNDGQVMIRAARIRNEMEDQRQHLEDVRSDLDQQKRWLEERRDLIADARNEKAVALSAKQGSIAENEAHITALQKDIQKLTAVIRARLSHSTGPVSTSGYIWPIRGPINQGYSRRHPGIDIDGERGDRIVAANDGFVGGASCSGGGYGICTIIDHGNGVATLYAHLTSKTIGSGSVKRGQVIGYMGCTGRCTGSHLHLEFRVNGNPASPWKFLP